MASVDASMSGFHPDGLLLSYRVPAVPSIPVRARASGRRHGQSFRSHQHGAVLRFRERRARRPGREVRQVRHRQGARAAAAQGQHRGQESVLRLGPLQGVQGADARGLVRADRDPARAPVGQELRRHPHGRRCAGPLLYEVARRHLRHHQRRFRFLAAGVQAARKRQARDRRRGEELDVGPADRQLRRVHLLRRSGARSKSGRACAQGRRPRLRARRRPDEASASQRRATTTPSPGSARADRRNGRGADYRARRGREDLGIDGQAGAQAPQARFHRIVLRIPVVQRPARGSAKAR